MPVLLALSPAEDAVPLGPFAGSLSAVVGDPVDPDFILLDAIGLGLRRREFVGPHWTWQPTGAGLPALSTTLERVPGSATDLVTFSGGTLFVSQDDGASWASRASGVPGNLKQIVIAPGGQRMLLLSATGFSLTADGGFSTQLVSATEQVEDAAFAPSDDLIAYRVGTNGLFRSDDGGGTWNATASGLVNLRSVAVDPSDPDRLLVSRGPSGGQALLLSEDGGATVSTVLGEFVVDIDWAPDGSFVHALRTVGLFERLYSSDDGGLTWSSRDFASSLGAARDMALTADGLALVAFDDAGFGFSGGLFRGSATTEVKKIQLFPDGQIDRVLALPGGDTAVAISRDSFLTPTVLAGTPPGQLKGSGGPPAPSLNVRSPAALGGDRWIAGGDDPIDGIVFRYEGNTWLDTTTIAAGADVIELHVHPIDRDRVVAIVSTGPPTPTVYWSDDGGDSWKVSGGQIWTASVANGSWDPNVEGRLLVVSGIAPERVFQSLDFGETFSLVAIPADLPGNPEALVADPFTENRFVRHNHGTGTQSRSQETLDGGFTWSSLIEWQAGDVQGIWFDPVGRGVALLQVGGELHLLEDGLAPGFVPPSPGTLLRDGIEDFSVDPDNGSILVGTSDRGAEWLPIGTTHGDLGGASLGTGGVRPRHFGLGLAELGTAWGLGVDRARGGTSGLLLVGTDATAAPLWGGSYVVGGVVAVSLPFVTNGTPGTGGEGAFELAVALPSDPLLVGVSIVSQALLLDPGAAVFQDRALSNGLRTTFR